jgi:hypothetical protein
VVPQTKTAREEQAVQDWEIVDDPEQRPEWATDRDLIIRFVDDDRRVRKGEDYPIQTLDGSPKYTTEFAGLARDQPDHKQRAMARQEQSSHLQSKGDALGVYSTDINMNLEGDVDHTVELDADTAAAIREATLDDE